LCNIFKINLMDPLQGDIYVTVVKTQMPPVTQYDDWKW